MRDAWPLLIILTAGCGGDDGAATCPAPPVERCATATSTPELAVVALVRVEQPVAGAVIVSHRTDGTAIGRGRTDAEGCAQVPSEPGALREVIPD